VDSTALKVSSTDSELAPRTACDYLGAMNEITVDWAKLKIEPLDEHLPTPEKIHQAWMRSRRGLWFYDLYAGYDWSVSKAYDQWVELALRMGWIDRDPLAE
jgi:hypothetical protein